MSDNADYADHAEVVRQQLLHLGPLRGAVGQESLDALVAERDRLREALGDAVDVAIWMSGSPSFSPEGEAHEGWVGGMREKLYAAMAALGEDA